MAAEPVRQTTRPASAIELSHLNSRRTYRAGTAPRFGKGNVNMRTSYSLLRFAILLLIGSAVGGCLLGGASDDDKQVVVCEDSAATYDYCKSNGLPPNQVECYPKDQPDSIPSGCAKSPTYDSNSILCCTQKFSAGGDCWTNPDGSISCP